MLTDTKPRNIKPKEKLYKLKDQDGLYVAVTPTGTILRERLMNAVKIEQAISELALQNFDQSELPYAFLEAFGSKAAPLKRLRSDTTNKSDLSAVLKTNNIRILVTELYGPEHLYTAHEHSDEVQERIHIGCCFKNDTERLEKLFGFYTKNTVSVMPVYCDKPHGGR